ncbi:hypothetical protein L7F22_025795 [Adiantum nelumboides]|nr:hypothetical protein [Adiantum nelumboides]
MAGAGDDDLRPHILAIPYPWMGHMTPVVQLCSILIATAGCRVTIACDDLCVPGLLKLLPESLRDSTALTVLPISGQLPAASAEESSAPPRGWDAVRHQIRSVEEALPLSLAPHLERFRSDRRLACIISDVFINWAQDIADQFGVPRLAVWISSPAELLVHFHAKKLMKAGKLPFKFPVGRDANDIDNMIPGLGEGRPPIYHRVSGACLDEEKFTIDGLPSLHRGDFPTFLQIEDASDILFSYFMEHANIGAQGSMVILNTFEALDGALLENLRLQGVNALAVGPLFMLEDEITKKEKPPKQVQKEEECLKWLDMQKPKSVIYVAFGTLTPMSWAQVKEIANGLLNSGHPFIWTCERLIGDIGETREEFMSRFLKQCQGRGFVLKWAPQTRILNHPSTGAFLTHCGWNSLLETMSAGVPALCLPLVSDQVLNCKLSVEMWKIGLGLEKRGDDGLALAIDISRGIQQLLGNGEELQRRLQELKKLAKVAVERGGSSYATLDVIMKVANLSRS